MKFYVFILILVLIFSCASEKITEKETIVKDLSTAKFINKQIFPVIQKSTLNYPSIFKSISDGHPENSELTSDGANGYIDINPVDVSTDFNNGWFYWNNSYYANSTIHTLDLGSITGGDRGYVAIDFSLIDGYHGYGYFSVREHNSNYEWQTVICQYNNPSLIWVLTDSTGKIDWRQEYFEPFCAKTHLGEPSYHDHRFAKFVFTAKYLIEVED